MPAINSTFNEPYEVARQSASLDHLSDGRAAWNVVPTWFAPGGENLRRDGFLAKLERHGPGQPGGPRRDRNANQTGRIRPHRSPSQTGRPTPDRSPSRTGRSKRVRGSGPRDHAGEVGDPGQGCGAGEGKGAGQGGSGGKGDGWAGNSGGDLREPRHWSIRGPPCRARPWTTGTPF
nr:LLM class flavin-dependent oxidoreductase [Actinoplanes atraurantiacus]